MKPNSKWALGSSEIGLLIFDFQTLIADHFPPFQYLLWPGYPSITCSWPVGFGVYLSVQALAMFLLQPFCYMSWLHIFTVTEFWSWHLCPKSFGELLALRIPTVFMLTQPWLHWSFSGPCPPWANKTHFLRVARENYYILLLQQRNIQVAVYDTRVVKASLSPFLWHSKYFKYWSLFQN